MARAPYAADPARSRGREFAVHGGGARGPRTSFQRDRDRIIHSIAFRRLAGKTQVFIAPDGDHFRVRLTHSLEVAQIGRVIARELELDEDLTEALCLAHDIGHPPFGHSGEEALGEALRDFGGYNHNEHTMRVLMRLDSPYCEHPGLNLSWEVLEGLAKHNGPVMKPGWALTALDAAFPFELNRFASLEAQVAALADDIAYDNHDIDDGLRSGFLQLDQLLTLDFMAEQWRVIERRFPQASHQSKLRELVRGQIGLMVNDLLATTRGELAHIADAEAIRGAGQPVAHFSDTMAAQERRLKSFLNAHLYHHPRQLVTARRAQRIIAELYAAYDAEPAQMSAGWLATMPDDEPSRARHVVDFIAGMTDRYAMDQYARILGHDAESLSSV